jgi:hypothetical protein
VAGWSCAWTPGKELDQAGLFPPADRTEDATPAPARSGGRGAQRIERRGRFLLRPRPEACPAARPATDAAAFAVLRPVEAFCD